MIKFIQSSIFIMCCLEGSDKHSLNCSSDRTGVEGGEREVGERVVKKGRGLSRQDRGEGGEVDEGGGGWAEREHPWPCMHTARQVVLSAVVAAAGSSTSSSRKQAILALSVFLCSHHASTPSYYLSLRWLGDLPHILFLCIKTLLNLYNSLFTGFCLQAIRFHRVVPLIPCHPKRVFASSTRGFCCMVMSMLSSGIALVFFFIRHRYGRH